MPAPCRRRLAPARRTAPSLIPYLEPMLVPADDRIRAPGPRSPGRCGTVRERDDRELGGRWRAGRRRRRAGGATAARQRPREAASGGRGLGSAGDPVDACAAERRVAAERCGLAVGARVRATEAADLLRAAQRTYDDHITAADAAAAIADARAVRREKEAAQSRFRAAYNGSKSTEEAEAAARDWLVDINEVNTAARTAAVTAKREKAAATTIGDAARAPDARGGRRPDRRRGRRRPPASSPARPSPSATSEPWPAPPSRSRRRRGANARPARSTRTSRWPRRCRPGSRRRSSASCAATGRRSPPWSRGSPARTRSNAASGRRVSPSSSTRSSRSASRRPHSSTRPTIRSGGRSPSPRTATSARPWHRSATGSTGSAGSSTTACPPSATSRWRWATPASIPMRIRQWPTEAEMAALYSDVDRGRRRTPRRDGRRPQPVGAGRAPRPAGRRAGRPVERLGSGPAAPARRGLTRASSPDRRQPGPSSSSSSMTTTPQRLGRGRADRRALLGGPGPDPRREALGVMDLAGVGGERRELALDRRRDVDPDRRLVRPEEVQAPDPMRLESALREPRERHRVARRRIDRVDRREPGRAMVGVVDAAVAIEEGLRVGGQDGVRVGRSGSRGPAARGARGRSRARRRVGAGTRPRRSR